MLNRYVTAQRIHQKACALERNHPERASELRKIAVALIEAVSVPLQHDQRANTGVESC